MKNKFLYLLLFTVITITPFMLRADADSDLVKCRAEQVEDGKLMQKQTEMIRKQTEMIQRLTKTLEDQTKLINEQDAFIKKQTELLKFVKKC